MRPSVRPSPLPFTFDSAVYAQGGVGARGLFGDTQQRPIHSNPAHRLQQKNHPTSSACGSALLQSLSLNPLSFCVAVIYSNAISLSSSSSLYSSLRFSNPPHHPPIIFPSPKLTEPPKAIRSDCLISRHRVRRPKWKMRIPLSHYFYSVFILSFIRLSSVSHFFSFPTSLSHSPSGLPLTYTSSSLLAISLMLLHLLWPFPGLPISPHSSSRFHSFLPSVLCWVWLAAALAWE